MFWGVLFIAIGVLVILRHYFGIQFPLIKVLLGLVLVYFGMKILFTSFTKATPGTPTRLGPSQNIGLFSSSRFQYNPLTGHVDIIEKAISLKDLQFE